MSKVRFHINKPLKNKEEPTCSCGCGGSSSKVISVDYLFLDLNTCDRCIGTDKVLEEVLSELSPALELAGYSFEYKKIEMTTAQKAEEYQFLSSPTIRVNGNDICLSVQESSCGCCSQISGTDVDCRVFEYGDKTYEVPPKAMIAEAILKGAFLEKNECGCNCYELPANLKAFYDGKENLNNELIF